MFACQNQAMEFAKLIFLLQIEQKRSTYSCSLSTVMPHLTMPTLFVALVSQYTYFMLNCLQSFRWNAIWTLLEQFWITQLNDTFLKNT